MRGGRCRSSAARAKCRLQNGFHVPSAWASGKQDWDALRRVVLTPHASRCSRLGRPIEHPFQGLGRFCDPLTPLENVGPSVYRYGMRDSSSSRALPIPPVPNRHTGDMRGFGHRYTAGMRGVPSIPDFRSTTGTRPACAGERCVGRPRRLGHPPARPSARRRPPFIRSDGVPFPIQRGLQISAANTPGIASALRFRLPAGAFRHRDRPRPGVATVPLRRPRRASP